MIGCTHVCLRKAELNASHGFPEYIIFHGGSCKNSKISGCGVMIRVFLASGIGKMRAGKAKLFRFRIHHGGKTGNGSVGGGVFRNDIGSLVGRGNKHKIKKALEG